MVFGGDIGEVVSVPADQDIKVVDTTGADVFTRRVICLVASVVMAWSSQRNWQYCRQRSDLILARVRDQI